MSGIQTGPVGPWWSKVAAMLALAALLAACGSDPPEAGEAEVSAGAATEEAAQSPQAEREQAGEALAEMGVDELREAARLAYAESRLYAPAGHNALEYYLALRERSPGDAAASSALTDLLPMTVIATEQSRDREDYEEALSLIHI